MSVLTGGVAGSSSRLAGGIITTAPKMVSDVTPMMVKQRVPSLEMQLGWFRRSISGYTKDSVGAILGTCVVDLFITATDVKIDTCISGTDGFYQMFSYVEGNLYIVAYKAGSPDIAGTTVNTLVGF